MIIDKLTNLLKKKLPPEVEGQMEFLIRLGNCIPQIDLTDKFNQYELFVERNVLTPFSIPAEVFHNDFYPAVVKPKIHFYPPVKVNNSSEFEDFFGERSKEYYLAQEFIQTPGDYFFDFRILVESYSRPAKEDDIKAGIIRYKTDRNDFVVNIERGGSGIPLTGRNRDRQLTEVEIEILESCHIDPYNRKIPKEILNILLGKNEDGFCLIEAIVRSTAGYFGYDFIYGKSASYPINSSAQQNLHSPENDNFYLMECNPGPGKKALEITGDI
jgi:hypothetical protein